MVGKTSVIITGERREYICIFQLIMILFIFDGLIYHQRTSRDLENHPCSFATTNLKIACDFMHNPLVAEYPNQRAIVEKRFYISIDY